MTKKNVLIDDLYRIRYLREIALSPDADRIAYTVEWMDKKKNKYFSNLYVIDSRGKVRHFIRGDKTVGSPQWSPDGSLLAFLATEKEKTNLWAIPVNGGEAYQITDANGYFGTYHWMPDGKNIICEFTRKDEDKDRITEKGKPPLFYYITKAFYKEDNVGILPADRTHIWKVKVKNGVMTQLTYGPNGDREPGISPDGSAIAFVTNRNPDYEEKFLYLDIYVIDQDGKNERRINTLTGPKGAPEFSPSGTHIAFIARGYPEEHVGWRQWSIWYAPLRAGKSVKITPSFKDAIGDDIIDDCGHFARFRLRFINNGRSLVFPATQTGRTLLCRVDIRKRTVEKYIDPGNRIYAYDHDGENSCALAISNYRDPGNLYLWRSGVLMKMTDINLEYAKRRNFSVPVQFTYKGYKNHQVQGWLMKPTRTDHGKKYPLCLEIHGGPHVAYGQSFFHEFQVLAGQGYAVFYSNPHGSTGYGERFARELHLRWGKPDYIDHMKAIAALRKYKFIDFKKMAVMGGSYGGFMTNWIIGHTDIFKAAISMRSVVNMLSFFNTDFGFDLHKEFVGDLWKKKNFRFYWDMSPLKYAPRINTPLLIMHSEQDHRCPIGQAEELFTALKILKKSVVMARFPEESHELSRHGTPRRREKRLELMLRFLRQQLTKRK
ncbi:MAG TPA: S9 family peptidase [bacterium]